MDFRYIECFYKVASNLNFAKAAMEMHISPSAVSRQIALLEESMKQKLFIRDTKHVRLTKEGEELLEHVELFLTKCSSICDLIKIKVSIITLQSLFGNSLLNALKNISHKNQYELTIDITNTSSLIEKIKNNEYDFGLTVDSKIPSSFFKRKIGTEKILLYNEHLDTNIVCTAYKDFRYLLPGENRVIYTNSLTAAQSMVKNHLGKAILPFAKELEKIKQKSTGSKDIMLIYKKNVDQNKLAFLNSWI